MPEPQNRLVQRLPVTERRRLLASSDPFELTPMNPLGHPGEILTHVYFPRCGYISLLMGTERQPPIEVGMVGAETVLGGETVLGPAPLPWQALVQGAGSSWRIETRALQALLSSCPVLQRLLRHSVLVRLHQLSLAPACVRFHRLEQRLARWLLMCLDRTEGHSFHMTHAFIAQMLGVRRVGVTVAASELQQRGVIHYQRGKITVLQRAALETNACSCYAADWRAYRALL